MITFPRELPEPFRVRSCTFEAMELQARGPARGGRIQVAELGPAVWTMRYETVPLAEANGAAWEAWLSSLRGGRRLFKAWHPYRRYGLAYPNGYTGLTRAIGGAFTGAATLISLGVGRDAATIAGLPAGYQVTPGDMISWDYLTDSRELRRAVEPATASAGGIATVTIEPVARPGPPINAAVDLARAWCHAAIDPASIDVKWSAGRRAVVSFAATQSL